MRIVALKEIPEFKARNYGKWHAFLDEVIASGLPVVKVEDIDYSTGRTNRHIAAYLRRRIKDWKVPIGVHWDKNGLYLVRTDIN